MKVDGGLSTTAPQLASTPPTTGVHPDSATVTLSVYTSSVGSGSSNISAVVSGVGVAVTESRAGRA